MQVVNAVAGTVEHTARAKSSRHLLAHAASRLFSIVLALLLASTVVAPMGLTSAYAAGSTYYVATTGSDTAAGTITAPWRTVQKAATAAKSGDVVYVRAGTYAERVTVSAAGTAAAPVVISGYGTERPLVTQGFSMTGAYITVHQFEVTPGYQGGSGFAVTALNVGGSHNTADDVYVHDLTQTVRQTGAVIDNYGTVANSRIINWCTYDQSQYGVVMLEHATLLRTHLEGESQERAVQVDNYDSIIDSQLIGPNESDMVWINGNHFLMKGTLLYKEGRRVGSATHTEMIGFSCTTQSTNPLTDIVIDGCTFASPPDGAWVENGRAWENAPFHVFFHGQPSSGPQYKYDNVHFSNNVFLSGPSRVADQNPGPGCLTNVTWYNNVFSGLGGPALDDTTVWRNNILDSGFQINAVSGGNSQDTDYNLYTGLSSLPSGAGSHSRLGNPGFVSPVTTAATRFGIDADWHVTSSATRFGASDALTPALDKGGSARTAPTAVGAYEYGITTPDTIAPTTTSNVKATYVSSAVIALTATDTGGSGVAGTYYKLDGGAQTTGTSVSLGAVGSHTLEFWSVDGAGNIEAHKTASFAITAPVTPPTTPPTLLSVYRFYNMNTGTHFYTANEGEKDTVINTLSSVYRFEGASYTINTNNPANRLPLYRFYNLQSGTHFYTASEAEKNQVQATLGDVYRFEGVAYYVSVDPRNATPVYRFYLTGRGAHFYTASASERDQVIATLGSAYQYEGVSYYLGN